MWPNLFLSLLYIVLLHLHVRRARSVDVTVVVVILYLSVAFLGIFYINMDPRFNNLAFWPYIYFFVSFCLLMQPVKRTSCIKQAAPDVTPLPVINLLILLYIVCAAIVIIDSWSNMISTILLGDWYTVKVDAYEGNGQNSSFLVAYADAFGLYFRFFIFPYCFYLFTQEKMNLWKPLFILVMCVVATMFHFLASAYRGGLFSILIMLVISYLLFSDKIPQKRKILIIVSGWVLSVMVIVITIAITNSRFEDTNDGPVNSLLIYFGQPMVNFNGGIAMRATSYMNGNYFFMTERNLDKSSFWIDSRYGIETSDGRDFDTLIGCFYIDFNPVIAFFVFITVAYMLKRFLNFDKRYWSSLYIIFFYLELITAGVFHGPSSLCHQVINVIVIYVILLLIERIYGKKNKFKNCNLLPQSK